MPLVFVNVFAQAHDRHGTGHAAAVPIQSNRITGIVIDPLQPLRFGQICFKWSDRQRLVGAGYGRRNRLHKAVRLNAMIVRPSIIVRIEPIQYRRRANREFAAHRHIEIDQSALHGAADSDSRRRWSIRIESQIRRASFGVVSFSVRPIIAPKALSEALTIWIRLPGRQR